MEMPKRLEKAADCAISAAFPILDPRFLISTASRPMPAFKDDYSNRMQNAAAARKALLEKFKSQPKADDPAVQERVAQQVALAKARDERTAAKKAQKEAERLAAEAEAKRLEEARVAAEKEARRLEGERALALLAEQKAARDARYAARKSRVGGKKK
jgi:hypothetical protein